MELPPLPPLPPLPLGEQGATSADPDALRAILRRHRRRQLATGALGLAVVLAAGAAGGFAVGHTTSPVAHGVQVAAAPPAASSSGGGQDNSGTVRGPAITAFSGSSTDLAAPAGPAFTQLLLRDAKDGTRVRLYEQQLPLAKFRCPTGTECPTPTAPPCAPSSFVTAEVSDDQVAGQTNGAVWGTSPTSPLEVVSLGVVGGGQPQPVLVVVARTQPAVADVTLTTPYGSDHAAPTGGWVALAVRLPADFSKSGTGGLINSTLTATDSSGTSLASHPLAQTPPSIGRDCLPPCIAAAAGSATGSAVAPGPGAPSGRAGTTPSAGTATAPPVKGSAPGGCPFPCPPAPAAPGSGGSSGGGSAGPGLSTAGSSGSTSGAGAPTIVKWCAAPSGKAPAPTAPPPAAPDGGAAGPTPTTP
ncbi:MAG TPA: hypothetical protein VFA84_04360 [Acidimicrobiales bacterium]|nr:hypothetical protein [Acidimicrobiales bacterium]